VSIVEDRVADDAGTAIAEVDIGATAARQRKVAVPAVPVPSRSYVGVARPLGSALRSDGV
jgi:hypothetical protein